MTGRIDRLEIRLQTSTNEVDLLKNRLEVSEKQLREATDRISQLEDDKTNKNSRIFNDDGRQFPTSDGRQLTNTSGMPTGCRDLIYLGHGGNGFYPVVQGDKINLVFCDFYGIFIKILFL